MVVDATTSPSCVETVSTRIALTETVTVSLCSPSSSVTLICTALSASTATPVRFCGLNPSICSARSYRPTGSLGNEYSPCPSVTVEAHRAKDHVRGRDGDPRHDATGPVFDDARNAAANLSGGAGPKCCNQQEGEKAKGEAPTF